MKRFRSFVSITLLGGFMVMLPMAILILFAEWLFGFLTRLLQPFSDWVATWAPAISDKTDFEWGSSWAPAISYMTDFMGLIVLLLGCFLIGLLVKTNIGQWLHDLMDEVLGKILPGYHTINKLVSQLLGGEGNASVLKGDVCRAYIMGRTVPTSVTGIITSKHENGDCTVYVPTAPFLTSGMVYHLGAESVEVLPHVTVEAAMRTVIACGGGSQTILAQVQKNT
ncbi:MAG TPA: DUF502 domain-containing protein [Cellvibrio sp.]|nr:DUF502 domain-containing protein [Cellvibrio sp.]